MDQIWQDIRFAARALRKQPAVTLIAVACLGVGIGANTAIFSVVRSVLLDSLPYREPDTLVRLYETLTANGVAGNLGSVSAPNYKDWIEQTTAFASLGAYSETNRNLQGTAQPERLRVVAMSANLLPMTAEAPLAGRYIREGEDTPGHNVVVLSAPFWRRRFGARREVVDSTIILDGERFTIVGVAADGYDLPLSATFNDVYVPLVLEANGDSKNRGSHYLRVIARLKPGMSVDAAAIDLARVTDNLRKVDPGEFSGRGSAVRTMADVVLGDVRGTLWILLGAVTLVLAIACVNVANLLLARGASRRQEVAIRTALGADSGRIVRQLLTESVLLSLVGGALGLGVAAVLLRAVVALAAGALPRLTSVGLDPKILGFAALVSVVTGVVFGIVPALRAAKPDLRSDLTESGTKTSLGGKQHRLLKSLVVSEIALSLVLFVGAGLLIRSFAAVSATAPGFVANSVLTFRTRITQRAEYDSSMWTRFYEPVLTRIRALPGVRSAGITTMLPIQSWGTNGQIQIVGRVEPDPAKRPYAEFRTASSGYFSALGVPIKRGREFDDHDNLSSRPVVMINEEFARRFFPNEDPIGKQLNAWSPTLYEIVGVAGDVRQRGVDRQPEPEVYVNAAQNPQRLGTMSFVVSTSAPPTSLVAAARAAVTAVVPDQPIYSVETMDQVLGDYLQRRKLILALLVTLAALALGLAAAGVYGVMAYTVSQRTRELGIRMALGASSGRVTQMVVGDGMRLAAIGAVIGVAASLLLATVMRTMVYGIGVRDPLTFAGATAFILVVACASSALPALRASKSDPLSAIRSD